MFLEGRPPVNVGVTSNGDIFGGTAGQLRRRARRQAVQLLRRVDLAVPHAVAVVRRTCRGASSTRCRATRRRSSSTASSAAASTIRRSRRSSAATTRSRRARVRGGTRVRHLSVQPLPPRRAVGRPRAARRAVQRPDAAGRTSQHYQQQIYGQPVFRNGTLMPLGVAFVQETTVFREFGPLAGSTMRLAYDVAPKIGSMLSRQTLRRRRAPLPAPRRAPALLATRIRGFKSIGDFPDFHVLRRQLATCAATTTCSSPGRTSSSPTPSCASR